MFLTPGGPPLLYPPRNRAATARAGAHATTRTRGPAAPRPPGPRRTGPDRGHGPRTGADGAPLAARPADGRAAPHQQRRGAAARRRTRRARGERARAGPRRGDEGRRRCDSCERRTVHNPAHAIVSHRLTSINLQRRENRRRTEDVRNCRTCEKRRFTLRRPRVGAVEDTHHTSTTGPGTARARVSRVAAGVHKSVHVSTSEFFLISSGPASRPCRAS